MRFATCISLVLFLALPGLASAVICKTIEADGTVSYADVPAGECQNEVKLPPYSVYSPRRIDRAEDPTSEAGGTVIDFDAYTAFRFVQPESDGTVRNNEGVVPVVLVAEPELQPGHTVSLTLDGQRVQGDFAGLSIVLNNVDRGRHSLRAEINDAAGRRLVSAGPVSFTLRQASINDPARARPETPNVPESPGYQPPPAPDFSPGNPPGSAPGTTVPRGTNPAFAPNYGVR
jgi:hypothetical protein